MAEILMECVDCHVKVKGEVESAFILMSQHTEGAHGRKPLRELSKYQHPTVATCLEDNLLLRPEIMLAA